ncbi:lamin tail domain-containing protein [Terriglobus sp. TAA 43]|uniref:lamin tail domain-containing protein n=1 Tax=Terriglobus sp. TAA 43 TaxID=278961 RepID=UPI0006464FCD|nr:lamin tail domain-containing protein [Terriglobus sp. TAA 43]
MKTNSGSKRLLSALLCALCALVLNAAAFALPAHVVISQVYGGGGNNGATYRYDFVELYNPGTTAVDLSSYTIQYASATNTNANNWSKIQLSGSIGAGKYYLAQLCIGVTGSTTGALLPTPDFVATNTDTTASCTAPALAAGAGKVVLVNNTTILTGASTGASGLAGTGCPTTNTTAIVDFVGYGSTANCTESSTASVSRTADLSATKSAIRDASNDDTNDNGTDFSVGAPNPRNSAYTSAPVTTIAITGSSATPANIPAGSNTVLSVTVTPGTATTSVTATVDLSAVGGSATQAMALSGTANTYTYTLTTSAGLVPNIYSLPVTVTDNTAATATGKIALGVTTLAGDTPISTIQANRNGYVNTNITFTGVITVVTNAGYYMQTASSTPGSTGDEGIYVYSGTGKNPAGALVGNNVTVTGKLTFYPDTTVSHTPSLEVTTASLTVNSTGNPLPTAIVITAPVPTGGIYQLRQYESMLVSLPSVTAVGGTDATLTENTETVVSNGQLYVAGSSIPRPFREPGMDFRDFSSTTCPAVDNCPAATNPMTVAGAVRPANLTLYDDNPERLIIESTLGGSTAIDVSAGATITGATGVVDYTYSTDYPYGDPARIILTAANRPTVSTAGAVAVKALALPNANQFTVAAFNVERFFDTNSANDLYYNPVNGKTAASSAVDVTPDAYARRLKKFSLAVRTVLNNPDIISVEEVENIQVLKDMAAQIDADTTTGTKPGYVAYGTDSITTFTNDIGGISIGFLVKPSTVNVTTWEQKGTQTLVAGGGSALNDRPSQVLHATINRGTGAKPYPITVISNHLRSLSAVNTATVQSKKELQAEMLANLIQGYQQAGEHVIAVGDMNAFQFSDGYTDTLGTITGNVGNGVAVMPGVAIVNPVATDLINTLPANAQQSYTEWGNAQVLDHAVVTADIAGSSTLAVGHIDADFPVVLYNDATTPAAMSDHDPLLAYLALPAPVTSATLTGNGAFATAITVGQSSAGQQLTLTNTGEAVISITGFTVTGDFAQSNNCGSSLAVGSTCAINVVFKPTAAGARTGSIALNGSATVAPVALTGTGLAVLPSFTMGDSTGNATTALTVSAGLSGTVSLKLTSTGGFAGSVAFTCASSGTAPTGVTCTVTSPVTLAAAGTANATVTLTTTARTQATSSGLMFANGSGRTASLLLAALLAGVVMLVGRKGRASRIGGLLMLLFALTMGVSGCGGSSHLGTSPNPNGTPNGTYTYKVTATSGSVSQVETVNLTVQ